ncbi:MAG TPA: nickel-dependent hydrogenase large subunit, partial [Desulfosarcina sp.]|nr:nickel-dependent hydrogenase large subunit [Desulfosarcina sp.]
MTRRIRIDPVTRLEGHGRIELFLDDDGRLKQTLFQVPDFRGFEAFCIGRPAEEMPGITQKICGVCPTAHHVASVKALDALFGVDPPPAGRMIRELMHLAFILEDHLLHFFFLGGPDILAGPDADPDQRNFWGVVKRLGREMMGRVLTVRRRVRELNGLLSGSPLYPVCGLPGGVSAAVNPENRAIIEATCNEALTLVQEVLTLFERYFLEDADYRRWIE